MSGDWEAPAVLKKYLRELIENYRNLIKILKLEDIDINNIDETALLEHTRLESEVAGIIISLTNVVYSYLEKVKPDAESDAMLNTAARLKDEASQISRQNIEHLGCELSRMKSRLSANKLPKTARRVYYSGETPTIMDIKI